MLENKLDFLFYAMLKLIWNLRGKSFMAKLILFLFVFLFDFVIILENPSHQVSSPSRESFSRHL